VTPNVTLRPPTPYLKGLVIRAKNGHKQGEKGRLRGQDVVFGHVICILLAVLEVCRARV